MTPPIERNPCLPVRRSFAPEPDRIRVVEIMATGTNGGAQEHVYNLVSRLDRDTYDVSLVSLSPGSGANKIERLGIPVTVIDEPDDAIATGILAAHLADVRPDVIHNHMYRAEVVGTKAAIALGEAGQRRPWIISTVHSSRVRSCEDQEQMRRLTPEMNHLIVVSNAIDRKVVAEGRGSAPRSLIYNGVDLERYDHQEPCCTLREEYGMETDSQIVGVVGRLELEKGHPTLLEAWPMVLEAVPHAYLMIVGEGSRLDALQDIVRDLGLDDHVVFTGRRDDIPAVTAAFDVAVLPSYREAQGLTILEAMALSRPVVASNVGGIPEMIQDRINGLLVPPQDPPALASAIVRLLQDHPLADMLGRAGHDMTHDRFCVQIMVNAVQDAVRRGCPPGSPARGGAGRGLPVGGGKLGSGAVARDRALALSVPLGHARGFLDPYRGRTWDLTGTRCQRRRRQFARPPVANRVRQPLPRRWPCAPSRPRRPAGRHGRPSCSRPLLERSLVSGLFWPLASRSTMAACSHPWSTRSLPHRTWSRLRCRTTAWTPRSPIRRSPSC